MRHSPQTEITGSGPALERASRLSGSTAVFALRTIQATFDMVTVATDATLLKDAACREVAIARNKLATAEPGQDHSWRTQP